MLATIVVFSGYILLISICPMLKAGKLHSIPTSDILAKIFKKYFKGGKIWWFSALVNCTKIPLVVLCWKSQQLTL